MLRDYQDLSLDQIRAEFLKGNHRVLLWLATGAGKTVIFCEMIKQSVDRGMRAMVLVRGRKLVQQASDRLIREGVNHGVMMAGHWMYRPNASVQVCSVDSLISWYRNRSKKLPQADLVIVDEADQAASEGYKEVLALYPNAFIVPVTATPYVSGGLRHIADVMVHPISMQELIDRGHLLGFRYFAPSMPDLEGVQINSSTKDYVVDQLEERMSGLTGDVVDHWGRLGGGMPTMCFAVNIRHSKIIRDMFLAAGVQAEHIEADNTDAERNAVLGRFERGETKIVTNVGIWTRGVDVPCTWNIIMARPTRSYNLFVQICGRGTRLHPESNKRSCTLLDHAGNLLRHGFPTLEPPVDLDGRVKSEKGEMESKICKQCFAVYRGTKCPECGVVPPEAETPVIENIDGNLTEVVVTSKDPVEQHLEFLKKQARSKGYSMEWVYQKLVDKFGVDRCQALLPNYFKSKIDNPWNGSPYSSRRSW